MKYILKPTPKTHKIPKPTTTTTATPTCKVRTFPTNFNEGIS